MIAIIGTYENGYIKLDNDYPTNSPVKVIVTFLYDIEIKSERVLSLSDFSFSKSQENLENFKGSLSETVIEERRLEE